MADLFIIREPESRGDVATVWNWKRREWCWDVDGEYTRADGFAYTSKDSAYGRAMLIIRRLKMEGRWRGEATPIVRVVDRAELRQIRELD